MSLIMVPSPSTSEAVERTSMLVSSRPFATGTGVSRSPSTRSFIRSAQAFMGFLMLFARIRATTLEITMERAMTARFTAMAVYVVER